MQEELEFLNKSNLIYVPKKRVKVAINTGEKSNYITEPLVMKLQLKTRRLASPQTKYTCLGQPFQITKESTVKFLHENQEYREDLWILPQRKDETILLGRDWLKTDSETKDHRYIKRQY